MAPLLTRWLALGSTLTVARRAGTNAAPGQRGAIIGAFPLTRGLLEDESEDALPSGLEESFEHDLVLDVVLLLHADSDGTFFLCVQACRLATSRVRLRRTLVAITASCSDLIHSRPVWSKSAREARGGGVQSQALLIALL